MSEIPVSQAAYYPFDHSIVSKISQIADQHRNSGWPEFERAFESNYHVLTTAVFKRRDGTDRQATFLDIRPRDGDDGEPIVHYGATGDVIDPNYKMHMLPLALALPHKRIIAVPNPSGGLFGKQDKLLKSERLEISRNNMKPSVTAALEYLEAERITKAINIGYSIGASSVWEAATHAPEYGVRVTKVVSAEPAAIMDRGFKIIPAFLGSEAQLGLYITKCDSRAFREARATSEMWRYLARLLTLGNLALCWSQSKNTYEAQITQALERNSELTGHILWGTRSKLAVNGTMHAITKRLKKKFGPRLTTTSLRGHSHAMCDDVNLYSGFMQHGLSSEASYSPKRPNAAAQETQ